MGRTDERADFQTQRNIYENPKLSTSLPPGTFAPTHLLANSQVLKRGTSLRLNEITDGHATTLLYGEIRYGIPPWSQPGNVRDPAEGLQHSGPKYFGGPWSDGSTQFVTADARVHSLNPDIDPTVLKALASPHGGETVTLPN